MADETKKNDQKPETAKADKPSAPERRAAAAEEPAAPVNLTQLQIQGQLESRFIQDGKSPEEAAKLAKARAAVMCGGG